MTYLEMKNRLTYGEQREIDRQTGKDNDTDIVRFVSLETDRREETEIAGE